MKYILSFFAILLAFHSQAHAALGRIQQTPDSDKTVTQATESWDGVLSGIGAVFWAMYDNFLSYFVWFLIVAAIVFTIYKSVRLVFELYYSKNLRYLQITLPRADSKLDKERETKKDF